MRWEARLRRGVIVGFEEDVGAGAEACGEAEAGQGTGAGDKAAAETGDGHGTVTGSNGDLLNGR